METKHSITRLPDPGIDRSGVTGDDDFVELWLRTGRRKSDHTRRAYRGDVGLLLVALRRAGRELRTATAADLQAWADGLIGKPATRARRIGAARSLFTFGHDTGYLAFNVSVVLEPPDRPNDLAQRILREVDVDRLLENCRGRYCLFVRVLYASGARVSEACRLKWKHVYLTPDGTAILTLHGKGGKTRHVPIAVSVASELEAARRDDEAFVFATRSGEPLHPVNAEKFVRRCADRAGLRQPVSPHWMRHAHASHALDHGANPVAVRDSLGHASLATTSRYAHVRPGDGSGLHLPLLKK